MPDPPSTGCPVHRAPDLTPSEPCHTTDSDAPVRESSPAYRRVIRSRELSALEAAHGIEVLLFVLEHEGCMKTVVYDSIGRSTSVQSRMAALESAGLITLPHGPNGRGRYVYLTGRGRQLAGILRSFNNGS